MNLTPHLEDQDCWECPLSVFFKEIRVLMDFLPSNTHLWHIFEYLGQDNIKYCHLSEVGNNQDDQEGQEYPPCVIFNETGVLMHSHFNQVNL